MKEKSLKLLLLICLVFLLDLGLNAQVVIERQAISSGGNSFVMANENYQITSTIGQPVAGTMANENYIVTAGFQQSGLSLVNIFTAIDAGISVFPNPTTDFVMLKSDLSDYLLRIYDSKGSIVFSKVKTSGNFVVDLTSYPAGEYILQVYSQKENLLSSTKIIKN